LGNTPADFIHNREYWILHEFRRRAHILIPSPPKEDCRLEWLALIQHYGGPTRLLDFTHSFYIATFFALENTSVDAAVWGVALSKLDSAAGVPFGSETRDVRNRKNISDVEAILATGLEGAKEQLGVLHVEPERLNERMAVQQGVFLFPKDVGRPFMANLAAGMQGTADVSEELTVSEFLAQEDRSKGPPCVKVILPHIWRNDILDDLHRMNIDAASLFPGLEGFARSLQRFARWG
jgi:hypothetical protein